MADLVAEKKLPLRHPAEIPTFIVLVVLNFAILGLLIDFLASAALIPPALRGTNWEATWRAVSAAIILVAPALVIVRQVQRASIRGTAVQLSRTQFPDLYASMDHFAARLDVKPTPALFLSNGNGTLNAFAAQSGLTNNYVVLSGAALEPKGELGLVLLTAGRYAADNVQADELVDQGHHLGGFWVEIAQLPRSHPWTVRRIWRLHQLGLFGPAATAGQAHPQEVV